MERPFERRASRGRRRALCIVTAVLAGLAPVTGCNVIDAIAGKPVRIEKMVPGGNVATGGLDCWLTLQIDGPPDGADPLSLRVRFESPALTRPTEFDWAYIAAHDVMPSEGGRFGSGHRPATATRPDAPPPAGETVKIRFPLPAREIVADAPSPLWLEAEVSWGGQPADTERRTIEHVYARTEGGFL